MKPTREEVLKLMRQASGGILTQVAEDPRCGYEIKVEELQTFAELLQARAAGLICKSCGVDRSKEDCKGDRLKCGLAGIAHSDHVAVTSAEPESRVECVKQRNAYCVCSRNASLCDGVGPESGISSPAYRPNEQNAVVIDESDLKLAFFDGYAAAIEDATNGTAPVIEFAWKRRQEGK